jgi:hypothetical protein
MLKNYFEFIIESNETMGKNLFKDYLKVFTALGLKDTKPNYQNSPDEFLTYFISIPVQTNNVKSIMSRFQQFHQYINSIDYNYNECQLYYGIKCDMMFEYGIKSEENKIVFGQFPVTKSNFRWLILLDSPSASNLKKEIISHNPDKLNLLSKIKSEVKKFNPGETEKRLQPEMIGDIMRFSYQGLSNGNLQPDQFQILKDNLMNYLMKYKWANKIQISITQDNPWLHLNIRLK